MTERTLKRASSVAFRSRDDPDHRSGGWQIEIPTLFSMANIKKGLMPPLASKWFALEPLLSNTQVALPAAVRPKKHGQSSQIPAVETV
jgi:hypothetical protein